MSEMSEISGLNRQAKDVVETAKDAMKSRGLIADRTTQTLSRTILEEAKRRLPENRILAALNFEEGELDWSSVRSVMQAVSNALSSEYSEQVRRLPPRHMRTGW